MFVSVNVGDNVIECDSMSTNVKIEMLIDTSDADAICVCALAFTCKSVADAVCTS